MFSKRLRLVAVAGVFAMLGLPVLAQTTQAVPTAKLVEQYTGLAGSEKNAKSLVSGLRTDSKITLEPIAKDDKAISFESPTGKLGNGEIDIALAIAEKTLSGDKNVTNQDLYKALMDQKTGVLQMRADGMGWGQIANQLGFRLGEVMRAGKADGSAQSVQRGGSRPEKVDKLAQRPERPERPMKPERPGR